MPCLQLGHHGHRTQHEDADELAWRVEQALGQAQVSDDLAAALGHEGQPEPRVRLP